MFDSDGTGLRCLPPPPSGDGTLRAFRIGDVALHSRLRIRSRTRMTDTRTPRAGPAAPSLSAAAWLFCPRTPGQGSPAAVPNNAGGPTEWLRRGTRTNAGKQRLTCRRRLGDRRGHRRRGPMRWRPRPGKDSSGSGCSSMRPTPSASLATRFSYWPRLQVGFWQIATDLRIRLGDWWRASRRTP